MEEIITRITHSQKAFLLDEKDHHFIFSIGRQISDNKSLTVRQCYAARAILKKYIDDATQYCDLTPEEFKQVLDNNNWENAPRITVQKRNEARYLGDNLLALSYHSSRDLIDDLAIFKPVWREGVSIITVLGCRLDPIIDFLGRHEFEIDQYLEEYLASCLLCRKDNPQIILHEGNLIGYVPNSEVVSFFLNDVVGATLI